MLTAGSALPGAIWEVANILRTSPKIRIAPAHERRPGRIIFFGQNGSTPTRRRSAERQRHPVSFISDTPRHRPSIHRDAICLSAAPLAATDYIPGTSAQCYWRPVHGDSVMPNSKRVLLADWAAPSNGYGQFAGAGELSRRH